MTDGVRVRPVATAADLRRFVALPYELRRRELQRGESLWVPPLRRDVKKALSREHNPFFEHGEAEYWLAERTDGRPRVVGRIAAIENRAHNEFHADRVGFFGFFECTDDQAVADALFEAAGAWLAQRGLEVMRGPASFSTNDECGLLVDGFDTPPAILTAYTPRYYPGLVEAAGFEKVKDLYQFQSVQSTLPEPLLRRARRVAERHDVRLRSIDAKRFDEELALIQDLYAAVWERNWGFVPLTPAEIEHLARELRPVLVPDLVVFAEKDGEPIGMALALPDLNVALKTNPSGRLFPGLARILWAARRITRIRVLLLGLKEEWRRTGLDVLLYHWIWEKGTAVGYDWAEGGWILEDNSAIQNGLARIGFEHYKTLRLYDRPL